MVIPRMKSPQRVCKVSLCLSCLSLLCNVCQDRKKPRDGVHHLWCTRGRLSRREDRCYSHDFYDEVQTGREREKSFVFIQLPQLPFPSFLFCLTSAQREGGNEKQQTSHLHEGITISSDTIYTEKAERERGNQSQ